jgi:hypothetical protein
MLGFDMAYKKCLAISRRQAPLRVTKPVSGSSPVPPGHDGFRAGFDLEQDRRQYHLSETGVVAITSEAVRANL